MIHLLFQTTSHFPVKKRLIQDALERSLATRVKNDVEISVSIVGDRRIRQLNRDYRQKDYATDVLSFGLNDPTIREEPFVFPPDGVLRLGDIVISYPQVLKQAVAEQKFVDDKIVELLLHGLDHLMGIHHPE